MELVLIILLLFTSIGFVAYHVSNRKLVEEVHLPSEITGESGSKLKAFNLKNILSGPAGFIERLFGKSSFSLPASDLHKRLASSNKIMSPTQFMVLKFFLALAVPLAALIAFQAKPVVLIFCAGIGFILPDIWLNNLIKKRRALIVKDLPLVIDLLNICVGAGLDFMVAVNRVIQEFRPCALIEEMKIMTNEIQMGISRRDALKNMSARINNPEISSFVRTLLQADRIGTPISEALKMQSEEIRLRWFQKGEEMALKAPIKLLFPLLIFILPVVLIIVAGPILIQFTRGGMVKF
ncbi:MAG: type II secretion system F family protein [Candidatus Omnitrophica bacterium]|nr:type II secretion system F family protein [Candidatus Omnitrophota bacterium]